MPRELLWIIEQGNTFIATGNAKDLLTEGKFRGLYVGTVKGWILDRHRMPDLLAYLESRGVPCEVTSRGEAA